MATLTMLEDSRAARGVVVGILSAIPAMLVMAASRLGPGMTNDSVTYAVAARSYADTGSLTTIAGAPMTVFPPGLPMALGTLARLGLDIASTDVVLNVGLVALAVVCTYWLANAALDDPVLALVPTAIISVSTSTLRVFSRLWTEPGFVVLTLVLLLVLTRAVRQARLSPGVVAVTIAATALAGTLRYVGLALIPIAALGAALADRRRGPRRMAMSGLLVGAASASGLLAVMARSLASGTGATGERVNVGKTPIEFASGPVSTFGAYLVPEPLGRLAAPVGLAVVALLAYGTWRAVRRRDAGMAIIVAFLGVYWLTLMAIAMVTDVEDVRYRYAAPVFAPLAILATFAARDLLSRTRGPALVALRAAVAAALVLAVPVALAQSLAYAGITGSSGHGYGSLTALDSALAAAIAELPLSSRIATNDPNQAYWSSGRRTTSLREAAADPSSIEYVALFDDGILGTSRAHVADPSTETMHVTLIRTFDDGRLYGVSSPTPSRRAVSCGP